MLAKAVSGDEHVAKSVIHLAWAVEFSFSALGMGQLGHLHGKRQHCERERSRNGNSHGQFAKENSLGANEGVSD